MLNPFKILKDFVTWREIISSNDNYIAFLRKKGVRVGENVQIYGLTNIIMDLTRPWLIEIGNNVEITANATFLTHGYDWCVHHKKEGEIIGSVGKIKINDNVFIGVNSTILPGTEIGENVIIAAGSVVKGVIEPNSVYGGVPAKKISNIDDYFDKRKKLQLEEAVLMVREYIKVYKVLPPIEVMHEHFWLFESDINTLNSAFKDKLALRGNYEKSCVKFQEHKPMFKDYKEFLDYCTREET